LGIFGTECAGLFVDSIYIWFFFLWWSDGGWWDWLWCLAWCRLGDGKKFQKYSIYYNNILNIRVPKNTLTVAAKKKNGKKILLLLLQKLSSHGP